MRYDEQHWFNDSLPTRVLPISTDAPKELTLLLDDQFSQIAALLKPGRRARE